MILFQHRNCSNRNKADINFSANQFCGTISGMISFKDYPFFKTEFTDDDDFTDYLKDMRSKSIFKSGIVVRANDKIITLMTCTNTINNRRLVVHAVLTSQAN